MSQMQPNAATSCTYVNGSQNLPFSCNNWNTIILGSPSVKASDIRPVTPSNKQQHQSQDGVDLVQSVPPGHNAPIHVPGNAFEPQEQQIIGQVRYDTACTYKQWTTEHGCNTAHTSL